MAKSRYSRSDQKTDEDGNRVYKTTLFTSPDRTNNDQFIELDRTRRLDILADEFYDDRDLWWVIAQANNLNTASFFVEAGTRLRIPMNVTRIFQEIEQANSR